MIALIFKQKIRGSSLIEVITAIIIISTIFALAATIYLNVQRSGFSAQRLKAEILVNERMINTLEQQEFQTGEWLENELKIYQTVTRYKQNPNLITIIVEVRDVTGKMIAEKKRLHYVETQP